jgi:hypothetical protein
MANPVKTGALLLWAALPALAALAAHSPGLSDNFLWDDAALVENNTFVSDCANLGQALSPANLFKVLPVPMSARPVVNATLIADSCAGGGPGAMRLTNLLFHAANSVLVFLLALTFSGAAPASAAAGLLFAVHPAAAEAVQIAVFRAHLLGFFFFACALLASVYYARRPALLSAAAALAASLLGMLSVETAAVLPAAAAAAVYFDSGREGLRRAAHLLAALLLALAFYAWFRAPRSGYDIKDISSPGIQATSGLHPAELFRGRARRDGGAMPPQWREAYSSPAANLYTMAAVAAGYARDAASPRRLSPDYNPEIITGFRRAALPLLFGLCFIAAAAGLLYFRHLSGLGLTLFLLALLPALNLVPLYNLKADRYLYFPLAGLALTAASLPLTAKKVSWALLASAALLFTAVTLKRAPVFRDDLAFFSEAVKRAPSSARARTNLSAALLRSGDCSGGARLAGEASVLDPGNVPLRLRRAYTLAACGRSREALPEAKAVLAASPRSPEALYLAGLLTLKRDRAAGRALLERALTEAPAFEEARLTLALLDKKKARELSREDKRGMEELAGFYRSAGLFF